MIGCTPEARADLERIENEERRRIEEEEWPYFWEECTKPGDSANVCSGVVDSIEGKCLDIQGRCLSIVDSDVSDNGGKWLRDECNPVEIFIPDWNARKTARIGRANNERQPLAHKAEAYAKFRAGNQAGELKDWGNEPLGKPRPMPE